MTDDMIKEFVQKVSEYFGNKPIPPFMNCDLALRDGARKILGLKPIREWRETDTDYTYEGHKIHCPKCGYECIVKAESEP